MVYPVSVYCVLGNVDPTVNKIDKILLLTFSVNRCAQGLDYEKRRRREKGVRDSSRGGERGTPSTYRRQGNLRPGP